MELRNVFVGKILLVDLNSGECDEQDLDEGLIEEQIGGAAVNLALFKRHADRDPIVIGTGPLTGTFAPSGCAGVVTGRSPVTGRVCHVPLLWQTAVELKYSGFDFVVLLGESRVPVRLWLHDEIAELADAGPLWGKDVWETTEALRHEHGDDYVQAIVIGPAAENGSSLAQLSEGYFGSRDIFGLGAAVGKKKLKAIAMRGMGVLDVASGFFEDCTLATREIRKGHLYSGTGMVPILEALGADTQGLDCIRQRAHRSSAAFNCAYAAYTFLMTEEAPDLLRESAKDAPGLLLTDPAGVLSLLFLKDALPEVLTQINRLGLEPCACGALLRKENITDAGEAKKRLRDLAGGPSDLVSAGVENVFGVSPWPLSESVSDRLVQAAGLFSHALPLRPLGGQGSDFACPEEGTGRARWWLERMAACLILGVCPLSSLLSPVFSLERMARWASKAAGWEGLDETKLRGKCSELISETVAMAEPRGGIPAEWVTPGWEEALRGLLQTGDFS